jgi:hypothetical protein
VKQDGLQWLKGCCLRCELLLKLSAYMQLLLAILLISVGAGPSKMSKSIAFYCMQYGVPLTGHRAA